jgi:hypothetical protein
MNRQTKQALQLDRDSKDRIVMLSIIRTAGHIPCQLEFYRISFGLWKSAPYDRTI